MTQSQFLVCPHKASVNSPEKKKKGNKYPANVSYVEENVLFMPGVRGQSEGDHRKVTVSQITTGIPPILQLFPGNSFLCERHVKAPLNPRKVTSESKDESTFYLLPI